LNARVLNAREEEEEEEGGGIHPDGIFRGLIDTHSVERCAAARIIFPDWLFIRGPAAAFLYSVSYWNSVHQAYVPP
jgi:hypothetical protein